MTDTKSTARAAGQTEFEELIGKRALLPVYKNGGGDQGGHDLVIQVVVRGVRRAYGRRELLVEPVAGFGKTWVTLDRVEFPAS